MHSLFLVKSDPVNDDCNDSRWKWFKGCLGALDGTYINVLVGNDVKPRFDHGMDVLTNDSTKIWCITCNRLFVFGIVF
ncbi:hypothetical protein AAHA92_16004 [Salvia divinorum]|uniref:Uncharacterized protein n=1 Tax=Salvia divinorum TaxID=28513 RepID=A0ABD1GUL3_SALDI